MSWRTRYKDCLKCGVAFCLPTSISAWNKTLFCSRRCYVLHCYGTPMDRFFASISPEPNTGCWFWMASTDYDGYGKLTVTTDKKRPIRAHRFSYEHFKGPIPPGALVCHRCDVPSCVNPDHLFVGTNSDNMMDCIRKSRTACGQSHYKTKLTDYDVWDIRHSPWTNEEIAEMFGLRLTHVRRIRRGEVWRHIDVFNPCGSPPKRVV